MTWKPGESGNPDGRPKNRDCIRSCLRILLDKSPKELEGYMPNTVAQDIAKKKIMMARLTDDWKEIDGLINQVDGNPKTPMEHTGDGVLNVIVDTSIKDMRS